MDHATALMAKTSAAGAGHGARLLAASELILHLSSRCSLNGTHYAHFVFRMLAGEVSVFIRARGTDESTYTPAVVHDRTKGLEVAGVSSPGFVGAVVGQDGLVPTEMIAAQAAKAL